MKKLFMFLAVAGLATFGASCSSDDSKNDDPVKVDLVLSASKTDVKEGDAVTFTIKAGGKVEAGAELYIGAEKVSSPYTFTKEGEYKVQAKKKDFNDSNVVTIKVTKKDDVNPEPKTLVLTPIKNEVFIGEAVTFAVKDNTGANVAGTTITQVGGAVVAGGVFVSNAAGTFKFVASKEGYTASAEAVVEVKARPVLTTNFFKYQGIQYAVEEALFVYNGSQNFNGGVIDTYIMAIIKMDGEAVDNRILGLVAFPRTTAGVKILPVNGQVGVAAWAGFEFTTGGTALETPEVTTATNITLSGMTFVDVEEGVKGATNGKIEYAFGLTGTEDQVTGVYEGEVIVLTEQQGANAIRSAYANGVNSVRMVKKQ